MFFCAPSNITTVYFKCAIKLDAEFLNKYYLQITTVFFWEKKASCCATKYDQVHDVKKLSRNIAKLRFNFLKNFWKMMYVCDYNF